MKHSGNTSYLTKNAQKLRKNMTKEELRLWLDFLKLLPVTVKRQKVIAGYIVDFCIPSAKLIIEIDGNQHGFEESMKYDIARDTVLKLNRYRVIRYNNSEINRNFKYVCEDIIAYIDGKK